MNVLIVGHGNGSWIMRGQQIGAALGARVRSQPSEDDWRWADVAILVKHAGRQWAPQAHRFGVPIIWDVLDCWRQPDENVWSVEQGKAFIAALQALIRPVAMIAATQRMAQDIGGVYIPHQCRLGLRPTPPRERVQTVAYDGQKKYLGRWHDVIEAECQRRGWTFVINPPNLSEADILVAFRDGRWDGPLCRAWKSGVKYVNAICAGRPIVTQSTNACQELQPEWSLAEQVDDLAGAFDVVSDLDVRRSASQDVAEAFSVESIAMHCYRPLLERVLSGVAA